MYSKNTQIPIFSCHFFNVDSSSNPFTAVSNPGGFRGGFRVTLLGFMQ